jgi:hypothetical protein
MRRGTFVCAVCGGLSNQCRLTSTNSFGSPDLDLRPAGMARHTLGMRIQVCPHCGYAAGDISRSADVTREWLKNEIYQTCSGIAFESRTAKAYFRRSLIARQTGDEREEFAALRCAAWVCDDAGERAAAAVCRKMAAEIVGKLLAADSENTGLWVMKADMMRRAGMFEQMIEEYGRIFLNDPPLDRLLDFEREKAAAHDDGRYTLDDAEK